MSIIRKITAIAIFANSTNGLNKMKGAFNKTKRNDRMNTPPPIPKKNRVNFDGNNDIPQTPALLPKLNAEPAVQNQFTPQNQNQGPISTSTGSGTGFFAGESSPNPPYNPQEDSLNGLSTNADTLSPENLSHNSSRCNKFLKSLCYTTFIGAPLVLGVGTPVGNVIYDCHINRDSVLVDYDKRCFPVRKPLNSSDISSMRPLILGTGKGYYTSFMNDNNMKDEQIDPNTNLKIRPCTLSKGKYMGNNRWQPANQSLIDKQTQIWYQSCAEQAVRQRLQLNLEGLQYMKDGVLNVTKNLVPFLSKSSKLAIKDKEEDTKSSSDASESESSKGQQGKSLLGDLIAESMNRNEDDQRRIAEALGMVEIRENKGLAHDLVVNNRGLIQESDI